MVAPLRNKARSIDGARGEMYGEPGVKKRGTSPTLGRSSTVDTLDSASATYRCPECNIEYHGHFRQGDPLHGTGYVQLVRSGSVHTRHDGTFRAGMRWGLGVTELLEGSIRIEGTWDNDECTRSGKIFTSGQQHIELGDYEGELSRSIPHGKGLQVWPNGLSYTGDFVRGVKEGHGEYLDRENRVLYNGTWAHGKPHGTAIRMLTPSGATFSGSVVNGCAEPYGSLYINGRLVYDGQFQDGQAHGRGNMYFNDGSTYEGIFMRGRRYAQGTMRFPDGRALHGNWFDDTILSPCLYTWHGETEVVPVGTAPDIYPHSIPDSTDFVAECLYRSKTSYDSILPYLLRVLPMTLAEHSKRHGVAIRDTSNTAGLSANMDVDGAWAISIVGAEGLPGRLPGQYNDGARSRLLRYWCAAEAEGERKVTMKSAPGPNPTWREDLVFKTPSFPKTIFFQLTASAQDGNAPVIVGGSIFNVAGGSYRTNSLCKVCLTGTDPDSLTKMTVGRLKFRIVAL